MNTRERFGNYLLLKKLTEDPLGETFRAGLLGPGGMEKVALLRVFNGNGVDGPRLWSAVEGRRPICQSLRSPNIGDGIEMGQIQDIPYVAWDYVAGKNMATLLEQAAKKRNFIPTEHALLITERVALALAAACETRHGGERILHGFLIPQLAMISNEGEARLLGFEVGPGLRAFASNPVIRQHFGRYLAPEALAGQPAHKADDIYSLGVFLFELLTGRPLPPPAADGYASVIDKGVLATEGEPIPEALRDLLKKSLVAKQQRLDDVVTWHKSLNTWMLGEGKYNPTTFNLAFFMHNLFRQEIERESQEIEVEKTLPVPTVQPPEPPPPPTVVHEGTGTGTGTGSVVGMPPPPVVHEGTGTNVQDQRTENFIPDYAREEKSKMPVILGVVAAVVIIAVAGAWMFLGGEEPPPPPPPVVAAPPPPPPEPQGPSEEEIQAKIQELIAQESSTIEDQLREQYDDELAALKKQLAEAQKRAVEQKRLEEERLAQEAEAERQAEAEKAKADEAARLAEAEKEKKPAEPAPPPAAETEVAATPPAAAPPPPAAAPPPKPAPPPPPKPAPAQVRRGDVVEMGAGVVPPEVIRIVPRYPEMARRINRRQATVVVRVFVDENGKALDAEQIGKEVGMGFDKEAVAAAKRGTYRAATKNGVPVKMWFQVAVRFTP